MRAHQRPGISPLSFDEGKRAGRPGAGVAAATGRLTKPSAVPLDRTSGTEARTLPVAWLRHGDAANNSRQ